MIAHIFKVSTYPDTSWVGLMRARIYLKTSAYLFEDSVSSANYGFGQRFVDRQDLHQI